MKRVRFSVEQIIRILKEGEALGNVRETCRQHNVTEQTYYRLHNKFAGLETLGSSLSLSRLARFNSDLLQVRKFRSLIFY